MSDATDYEDIDKYDMEPNPFAVPEVAAELVALRTALETAERERDEARADRDAWKAKAEAAQAQLTDIRESVTEFGGVHVCEGGGPENIAASVAVSFAKIQRERDRRPDISSADAARLLPRPKNIARSFSMHDMDAAERVVDALRAHASKAVR